MKEMIFVIVYYILCVGLTLYDLSERISSVWLKFRIKKKKKGSLKKFPMSAASMSR